MHELHDRNASVTGPPDLAAEIMKPYGGAIDIWEVGKDVGNVRHNSRSCLIAWRSFEAGMLWKR
jgi:hypothetical protein